MQEWSPIWTWPDPEPKSLGNSFVWFVLSISVIQSITIYDVCIFIVTKSADKDSEFGLYRILVIGFLVGNKIVKNKNKNSSVLSVQFRYTVSVGFLKSKATIIFKINNTPFYWLEYVKKQVYVKWKRDRKYIHH
jgi:hypothetical protein